MELDNLFCSPQMSTSEVSAESRGISFGQQLRSDEKHVVIVLLLALPPTAHAAHRGVTVTAAGGEEELPRIGVCVRAAGSTIADSMGASAHSGRGGVRRHAASVGAACHASRGPPLLGAGAVVPDRGPAHLRLGVRRCGPRDRPHCDRLAGKGPLPPRVSLVGSGSALSPGVRFLVDSGIELSPGVRFLAPCAQELLLLEPVVVYLLLLRPTHHRVEVEEYDAVGTVGPCPASVRIAFDVRGVAIAMATTRSGAAYPRERLHHVPSCALECPRRRLEVEVPKPVPLREVQQLAQPLVLLALFELRPLHRCHRGGGRRR
mmetsp:Transcript_40929/g.112508  ORF Transcript_40929/g.112508 Transcript_40929/m.112508 type:complete len:318 (+) Transcript_40929:443-1396(+)